MNHRLMPPAIVPVFLSFPLSPRRLLTYGSLVLGKGWRPASKVIIVAVLALALIVWGFIVFTHRNGNFHVVESGQLYRAGRVSDGELARLVKTYGIRTVINLEGTKPSQPWYQAETAVLDRLGIRHYDYGISATHIVEPARVDALLGLLRDAPKPILIHCRDGADRSGLVAALYLAKIRGRDQDEAYKQLSLAYGHFQYLGSGTEEMDDTYWATVDPVGHPD